MSRGWMRTVPPALLAVLLSGGCKTTTPTDNGGGTTSPGVTGVTVTAPANTVKATETIQLHAQVQPGSASQTVTWSSSDQNLATVDGSGLVSAIRTGTVTITATSTADASKSGSIQLGVECPTPREVTSDIDGDTTWEDWVLDPVCFDYVVSADLDFNSGLLTIEPGAVVGFEEGHFVRVRRDAGLNAAGLADNPIRLTGTQQQRGYWLGILFDNTDNPANIIEHTTIEYGGAENGWGQGVQSADLMVNGSATLQLANSTLQESAAYGLFVQAGAQMPNTGGNTMTKNTLGPAYAYASVTHYVSAGGSQLLGNDQDIVTVQPDRIDEMVTWAGLVDTQSGEVKGAYRIMQVNDRQAFTIDGQLVLQPGVTIAFDEDMAMLVRGGLSAVGTADLPIRLTGTQQVRGHWRGLGFTDTDDPMNHLDHVIIEYGGRVPFSVSEPADLVISHSSSANRSRVVVSNTTLRESVGYGLFIRAEDAVDNFTGNTLTNNTLGPAYVAAPAVDQLLDTNSFAGNDVDFVMVPTGGGPNNIRQNAKWRDLGVPYRVIATPANELTVEQGAVWRFEPGADVRFGDGVGVVVKDGSFLVAAGTSQDPVTLQGDNAQWRGIQIHDAFGYFDHTAINDAGSAIWSGAQKAGAVTVTASNGGTSKVTFTGDVTNGGAEYGTVFTLGDTFGSGCLAQVFIPPPDEYPDHCNSSGFVTPPASAVVATMRRE